MSELIILFAIHAVVTINNCIEMSTIIQFSSKYRTSFDKLIYWSYRKKNCKWKKDKDLACLDVIFLLRNILMTDISARSQAAVVFHLRDNSRAVLNAQVRNYPLSTNYSLLLSTFLLVITFIIKQDIYTMIILYMLTYSSKYIAICSFYLAQNVSSYNTCILHKIYFQLRRFIFPTFLWIQWSKELGKFAAKLSLKYRCLSISSSEGPFVIWFYLTSRSSYKKETRK